MAMEVNAPKRLLRHTLPVLILLAVAAIALSGHSTLGLSQAQSSALANGLVTRVLQVRPAANGLATITLHDSPATWSSDNVLVPMNDLPQAGATAQLFFTLQAPDSNQ